ncbi:hypothetical protein PCANC_01511 [Puccinia coronata f. sp. avenae]|uniref:Uncharacterized protein n=1 Tax=Puccinia coronata f. sp. avenae TaxID=200324 RepID=A0A2N5W2W9_9BASI|nr:hypothetical protein PCANC_01511 [Puccinia coronata f. sp. avenae]
MARSPTSSPGLRPRSSSSTLPNRFPSRQSTRIITPAKIHGNYIRTSNDNCRSSRQGTQDTSEINLGPSTQNTPIKKRRKQVSGPSTCTISQSSKSRKRPTVSKQNADKHQRVENPEFNQGLTSESDPDEDTRFMDLTQNSDQENAKITAKAQSKKTQGDILSEFDCINLYFFPPDYDRDQTTGPKLCYKCKWCLHIYKKGPHTRSNLYKHRDGAAGHAPCKERNRAIKNRARLPVTVKEKDAQTKKQAALDKLVGSSNFENRTLNQILVMWLMESVLPWIRLKDALLSISFSYARDNVKLYSCTWAATEAHRLYINLQKKVISSLAVRYHP